MHPSTKNTITKSAPKNYSKTVGARKVIDFETLPIGRNDVPLNDSRCFALKYLNILKQLMIQNFSKLVVRNKRRSGKGVCKSSRGGGLTKRCVGTQVFGHELGNLYALVPQIFMCHVTQVLNFKLSREGAGENPTRVSLNMTHTLKDHFVSELNPPVHSCTITLFAFSVNICFDIFHSTQLG